MSGGTDQRITLKRARPNPLLEEWLEELHEEAKQKNSKLEPMLKTALESLRKYPLPLRSGEECAALNGFGKKLCQHINDRFKVHKYNLALTKAWKNSSLNLNTNSSSSISKRFRRTADCLRFQMAIKKSPSTDPNSAPEVNVQSESSCILSEIEIGYRSAYYSILLTLLAHALKYNGSLTKEQIIAKGQRRTNHSFTKQRPGSHHTAWAYMSKLISKGLVKRKVKNKKTEYALTEVGIKFAEKVWFKFTEKFEPRHAKLAEGVRTIKGVDLTPPGNDIILNNEPTASSSHENIDNLHEHVTATLDSTDNPELIFKAGTFDIILIIDKNETNGLSKKNDATVAEFNKYKNLKHEYRSLKVGDFTWVVRSKLNKDQELVLPYIVERKRLDDLAASIKDGRFHEQKFRLHRCNLQNVIYLVENYGNNKHLGLPIQNLRQAIANTIVQDGFKVHMTDSFKDSARFLAMVTTSLTIKYKHTDFKGCNVPATPEHLMTFEYFNKASTKTKPLTVTQTFIKLLVQLKGLSIQKALAITAVYKTPRSLIVAYQKCTKSEGESLLENLKHEATGCKVGRGISKCLYQFFTNKVE